MYFARPNWRLDKLRFSSIDDSKVDQFQDTIKPNKSIEVPSEALEAMRKLFKSSKGKRYFDAHMVGVSTNQGIYDDISTVKSAICFWLDQRNPSRSAAIHELFHPDEIDVKEVMNTFREKEKNNEKLYINWVNRQQNQIKQVAAQYELSANCILELIRKSEYVDAFRVMEALREEKDEYGINVIEGTPLEKGVNLRNLSDDTGMEYLFRWADENSHAGLKRAAEKAIEKWIEIKKLRPYVARDHDEFEMWDYITLGRFEEALNNAETNLGGVETIVEFLEGGAKDRAMALATLIRLITSDLMSEEDLAQFADTYL